jgi:hypothetical protein
MEHSQVKLLRDSKPPVEANDKPWIGEELRHLWALANKVFGRSQATERVYDMIALKAHKTKLRELSRPDFLAILNDLRSRAGEELDTIFAASPMELTWRRIRWLQRELRWTDSRLVNYILFHGRKTNKNVESIRWLTVDKAKGIIVGMQRMRDRG